MLMMVLLKIDTPTLPPSIQSKYHGWQLNNTTILWNTYLKRASHSIKYVFCVLILEINYFKVDLSRWSITFFFTFAQHTVYICTVGLVGLFEKNCNIITLPLLRHIGGDILKMHHKYPDRKLTVSWLVYVTYLFPSLRTPVAMVTDW